MPISGIEGEVTTLSRQFGAVVQLGLMMSTVGHFSVGLTGELSKHSSIDAPDPMLFRRLFEVLYDRLFDPVGAKSSAGSVSLKAGQISYHLGVGIAVIALSTLLYTTTAGLLVGAKYAAYYTGAFSVQVAPFFRSVIALVVLFAISVMFHSQMRAKDAVSSK